MKKLVVLLSVVMILAGCAGTMPDKADLYLEVAGQPAGVYPPSLEASVVGRDGRTDPYIIM